MSKDDTNGDEMNVKERLSRLVVRDTRDKRTQDVKAFTSPDGRRWLFATNGHALAMAISNEEAEAATFIEPVVLRPQQQVGRVSAKALDEWVGEPARIQCDACVDGRCSRCKEGPCIKCRGSGTVPVWTEMRPGEIADRVLNRDLVFCALDAVGTIAGDVNVATNGDSHDAVWFSQEE